MLTATILALALAAPVPPDKAKPIEIDLSEAFATVAMKGLKFADDAEMKNKNDLKTVRQVAGEVGASNIFLVRGESFAQALMATSRLYGDGWGWKDEPVVAREGKQAGAVWVGAFLGNMHSSPAAFEVKRVQVDGQTVRVVYGLGKPGGRSKDVTPYLVWAKLGRLEPGAYRLELVDADQKDEVVMSRRVVVNKGND